MRSYIMTIGPPRKHGQVVSSFGNHFELCHGVYSFITSSIMRFTRIFNNPKRTPRTNT